MAVINISNLEKNETMSPFHIAAGIEDTYDSLSWDLSETETLLYQIHQAYPDAYLKRGKEAEEFLKSIEPEKARGIRKRAEDMFGIAGLMTKGSTIKLERRGKEISHEVSPETYQGSYASNPARTKKELGEEIFWKEYQRLFNQWMEAVNLEVEESEKLGFALKFALPLLGFVGLGFSPYVPAVVFPTLVGSSVVGLGVAGTGGKVLKEVRLNFWEGIF